MKYFGKDELTAILEASKTEGAISKRNHLMILLTVNHGLRVSEVLNLTMENFSGGYLIVQRLKGSKRTVQPLLEDEKALLAAYGTPTDPSGKLFTICRKTAWETMKRLGKKANVPLHKSHPHALKHTCAKLGLSGGMSIPELKTYLGHASGASTLEYLKEDDDTASKAFAKAMGGK